MSDQSLLKQRQIVTVAVCDICDWTAISERLELEELGELLADFRENANAIASEHGGTIVRIDGDNLVILFGYPASYEDAAKRATDTSLMLHEWADAFPEKNSLLNGPLSLHTGIHSGVVLLQDGDLSRGRFEILGDTTNVASRLCKHANSNEIVISCDALGTDYHFFETTDPELINISGRTNKLLVCNVRGKRNEKHLCTPNLRKESAPLIGREREVEWLTKIMSHNDPKKAVIVRSEAGMGKSRLLSKMLNISRKKGYSSHWGYCRSYRGSSELEPIRQLSLSLSQALAFNVTPNEIPSYTNQIADIAVALNEFFAADNLQNSPFELKELVAEYARAAEVLCRDFKGVALFLDDWHWADDTSKAFLDNLIDAGIKNLLIIVALRIDQSGPINDKNAASLELKPLSRLEAAKLAERIEPAFDAISLSEIYHLSGGNPLFIEELSYAARRNEISNIAAAPGAWLHTIIQKRFSILNSTQRRTLEVASAIGHVFPYWLLADIVGEAVTEAALVALQREDFLFPSESPGQYRFKHGITRDAVYGLIAAPDRRKINEQIVQKLIKCEEETGKNADPGELARYCFECADFKRAVEYSILAGNAALSRLALDKAQYHFQSALDHLIQSESTDEEIVFLLRRYGQACIVDPSWEMASVFERVIAHSKEFGHASSFMWAEYYLAFIQYGLGDTKESLIHYESVKKTADDYGNPSLGRRVEASVGQVYAAACLGTEARKALDRSIAIQRSHFTTSERPSALAYTLACKGHTLMDMGETAEADRHLNEAINLMRNHRTEANMSIRSYQGAAYILAGRFHEAVEKLRLIFSMAEQTRSRYHLAQSRSLLNIARFYLRRDKDILEEIRVSAEQWAMKSNLRISIAYGSLCDGYAQTGDAEQAKVFAAKALDRAYVGDRFGETAAYRALSLLALKGGDSIAAHEYVRQAYSSARRRQSRRDELLTHFFVQQCFGQCETDPMPDLAAMGVDPTRFFLPPRSLKVSALRPIRDLDDE